jgi:hypothetical protein
MPGFLNPDPWSAFAAAHNAFAPAVSPAGWADACPGGSAAFDAAPWSDDLPVHWDPGWLAWADQGDAGAEEAGASVASDSGTAGDGFRPKRDAG